MFLIDFTASQSCTIAAVLHDCHHFAPLRMEATSILQRRFFVAVGRALTCDCSASTLRTTPASRPLRRLAPVSVTLKRPYSSTPPRWLENVVEPDMKISQSLKHPSSPPPSTPKATLQNYINDLQKIIDGYQLQNRNNMSGATYEHLFQAMTNAEARLHAPGVSPESFTPLLESLQQETISIIREKFGTTDLASIVANIGKEQAAPARRESIGAKLDKALSADRTSQSNTTIDAETTQRRMNILSGFNDTRSALRDIFASPSKSDTSRPTVSSGLMAAERAHRELNTPDAVLRLSSSIGKTVEVGLTTDVTRAFQKMETICRQNGVRKDLNAQRFHIRRGQLKKNLRILRWEKLFKEGFVAECGRVRRMRRQGW